MESDLILISLLLVSHCGLRLCCVEGSQLLTIDADVSFSLLQSTAHRGAHQMSVCPTKDASQGCHDIIYETFQIHIAAVHW